MHVEIKKIRQIKLGYKYVYLEVAPLKQKEFPILLSLKISELDKKYTVLSTKI